MVEDNYLPRVLLLGRPNVGKSTLFNRLLSRRLAITDARPHTTRDVLTAPCEFGGARFELLDGAGFLSSADDTLQASIRRGLDAAAATADLILLVGDGREGVLPLDLELARFVRRLRKPVLPLVNKVDGAVRDDAAADFYQLGFDHPPFPISAKGGYNCFELLEEIVEMLGGAARVAAAGDGAAYRIAIAGRPNVGKSSLLNCLAGAPRVVVHETPGTTRDAVDVAIVYKTRTYVFVDTAGIRRKTRAKEDLEQWGLAKSLAAIRRAAAVVLVLDGAEGPTSQDAKIASFADKHGRALVLFLNKADLVPGGAAAVQKRLEQVRRDLGFAAYAPLLVGSAMEGFDVRPLYAVLAETEENHSRHLGTGELNRALQEAMGRRRFSAGGRDLKLRYAVQVGASPPVLNLYLNTTRTPAPEFGRFIENRLREAFPLTGTPVRFNFVVRESRTAK